MQPLQATTEIYYESGNSPCLRIFRIQNSHTLRADPVHHVDERMFQAFQVIRPWTRLTRYVDTFSVTPPAESIFVVL